MPKIIPLAPQPIQTETVTLGEQVCQINTRQMTPEKLYVDLYVGNDLIVAGVIAQNQNRIVRYAYYGFIGDLVFVDTQGSEDPNFAGLGTRWLLFYLTAEELIELGYVG